MNSESTKSSTKNDAPGMAEDRTDWNPDPKAAQRRLEAVMFYATGPLTSRKISQLAGLEDGTQARTMLRELNQRYDQLERSFQVKRVAGGYQLVTRPQFAKWLRRLEHIPKPSRLSSPAMETLSVVAYRQPIIKADIEAIRGVSCGEMLRQLLEKGLIRIGGRSEELGRPYLYVTSKDFLMFFGLDSLDALPRADQLAGQGLPAWAHSDHTSESDSDSASENADETGDPESNSPTQMDYQADQDDEDIDEPDENEHDWEFDDEE